MVINVSDEQDCPVFEFGRGSNILAPTSKQERDHVVQTLRGAIAYLDGLGDLEAGLSTIQFETFEIPE